MPGKFKKVTETTKTITTTTKEGTDDNPSPAKIELVDEPLKKNAKQKNGDITVKSKYSSKVNNEYMADNYSGQ